MAFDLAWFWKATPDHYLAKSLSELLEDHEDTVAFMERSKSPEDRT
ncbi:hypothetical protein [Ancylobacter sonchi]|nr:hypothetical protein [Ancylobacter sonchi]